MSNMNPNKQESADLRADQIVDLTIAAREIAAREIAANDVHINAYQLRNAVLLKRRHERIRYKKWACRAIQTQPITVPITARPTT